MKWELRIFEARAGVANIPCRNCARVMYIPPSKVGQRATCSNDCRAALAAAAWRACEACGTAFRPRKTQLRTGGGRFCSQACNSGKEAAGLRAYRAANPHKVKEFSERRRGRMTGRLPRGTIKRIGDAQRWRCAICKTGIKVKFSVDHVTPLARGGEHVPRNLQLLCRPCNVRKNARDPIEHMRTLGRLL